MPWPAGPAASNHTERIASSAKHDQTDAERVPGPRREDLPGGRPGRLARAFFLAVRFLDDGEDRRAGARRAVFCATYTSMITGRMTGLRWVTS